LNGCIFFDEIWNLPMKFYADYDWIQKNSQKDGGGGDRKNDFFFANADYNIFFIKSVHLGPISSSISFVWVPCSEAEIKHFQNPRSAIDDDGIISLFDGQWICFAYMWLQRKFSVYLA